MVRTHSRRRVFAAAAGLALNVVMVACTGHARGERATTDSSAVTPATTVDSTTLNTNDNNNTAATTPSTSTSANASARSNRESTDSYSAPRVSRRERTTEVSAAPADEYAPARSARRGRTDTSRVEYSSPTTDVSVTPDRATVTMNTPNAPANASSSATPAGSTMNPTNPPSAANANAPAAPAGENSNPAPTNLSGSTANICYAGDVSVSTDSQEFPSAKADASATPTSTDSLDAAKKPETAMAPTSAVPARTDSTAKPANDDAMNVHRDVNEPAPSAKIVPCIVSGEKRGAAAGRFLNDAQVAHAFLMANTIDSAVSYAALHRSQNAAVKAFAEMMVRDHTAANQAEAALLERLHIAPATNDISDDMLGDVGTLANAAPAARTTVGVTTTTTLPAAPARPDTARVAAGRDTLHLSNPFVAAANMQPWSSLLNSDGSVNQTTTSGASVTATKDARVTANVTTSRDSTTTTVTAAPVTDFDRRYADYQVEYHQKVLDAIDTRLMPWASPEQRSVLESARPTVASHLEAARQLQRQLQSGGSTTDKQY